MARAARATSLALGLWAAGAAAQDREDFQIWTAVLATAELVPAPPSFALWLDVHARRADAGTVHILRPGVGAALFPFLSVWAGYAWVPTFRDATDDAVHEHRIWQQVVLQHRTEERLALQSRTRVEQRLSDQGRDAAVRLRQLVRIGWEPWADVPLGFVLWDELFVGMTDTTDWGAPGGMDQNRLFAGLSLAMAPFARLEAGYLFVYVDRASDLFAHVVAVNLFLIARPSA